MRFRPIAAAVVLVITLQVSPVQAQEAQGDVPIQEFESAGQLICAWRPMQAANVVQVCEELGFGVLRTTPFQTWVVCDWKDRLDPEKLNALRRNPGVLYVEPNYLRTASPLPSDVNRLPNDENPPGAVMPDQLMEELQKNEQMICAWRPGKIEGAVNLVQDLGLEIVRAPKDANWIVCSWQNPLKRQVLDKLLDDPSILYIEPNYKRAGDPLELGNDKIDVPFAERNEPKKPFVFLPQDPFLNKLWGMKNINVQDAWRVVQESPVIVAVADSGVDYNHEDLRANMWRNPKEVPGDGIDNDKNGVVDDVFGADYIDTKVAKDPATGRAKTDPSGRPIEITDGDPMDEHYHGTHVAGTIGAVGNNGVGVVGVNWRVQIMAVRCLGKDGFARVDSVANSIKYAADNGAKVVNLSLGGRGSSQTDLQAIKYAREKGVVLVCAAGNASDTDKQLDNDTLGHFPSSYASDNIIAVSNIDIKDDLNLGSHFGRTKVHIGAPGTDIFSTFPMSRTVGMSLTEAEAKKKGINITLPTKYASLTGTSMATPHVAGALALVLGHPTFQSKGAMDAKAAIINAARPIPSLSGKCTTGGTLDLAFLGKEGSQPTPIPSRPLPPPPPPVVWNPQRPPCYVYYVPICYVPQYRCRVFSRCQGR